MDVHLLPLGPLGSGMGGSFPVLTLRQDGDAVVSFSLCRHESGGLPAGGRCWTCFGERCVLSVSWGSLPFRIGGEPADYFLPGWRAPWTVTSLHYTAGVQLATCVPCETVVLEMLSLLRSRARANCGRSHCAIYCCTKCRLWTDSLDCSF